MEFCAENSLFIANSNYQHHKRRLYTWLSPDGRTRNQIDYLLIRSRWRTSVRDVKTYPGMDCGSNHNALVAEIYLRLKVPAKRTRLTNRWHLGDSVAFRDEASSALARITEQRMESLNSGELWLKTKSALEEAAKKTIRAKSTVKKKP